VYLFVRLVLTGIVLANVYHEVGVWTFAYLALLTVGQELQSLVIHLVKKESDSIFRFLGVATDLVERIDSLEVKK
jgi:hypothetical protein